MRKADTARVRARCRRQEARAEGRHREGACSVQTPKRVRRCVCVLKADTLRCVLIADAAGACGAHAAWKCTQCTRPRQGQSSPITDEPKASNIDCLTLLLGAVKQGEAVTHFVLRLETRRVTGGQCL